MARFVVESNAEALERGLRNARHLRAIHAPAVAAARALAAKIDAWDTIVRWAHEDVSETSGRPAVPANDNVSIASYLKYLEALGLTPKDDAVNAASPSTPGRPATKPANKVLAFRQKAQAAG